MMTAYIASWFSLILNNREGSRSEFGVVFLRMVGKRTSCKGGLGRQDAGERGVTFS